MEEESSLAFEVLSNNHNKYPSLINNYGSMLLRGYGTEQNEELALALLLTNEYEISRSIFNIASYYFDMQEYEKSLSYFKESKNGGDIDALIYYAKHFRYGLGVPINLQKSKNILVKGYSSNKNAKIAFELFTLFVENEQLRAEVTDTYLKDLLDKAVYQKIPSAIDYKGRLYFNGSIYRKNLKTAKKLFELALDLGSSNSLHALAIVKLVLKDDDSCEFLQKNEMKSTKVSKLFSKYCQSSGVRVD